MTTPKGDRVIVTDEKGNRIWHSGVDPLEDVQIGIASKKRFMEWWKRYTSSYPVRTHKGVVDCTKIIRMSTNNGIDIVGAPFNVNCFATEEFPFRMNAVDEFTIVMPELRSFKNCPRYCKISGQFGAGHAPMMHTDSLIGCPRRAKILTLHTKNTMINLETSLEDSIEHLNIYTPQFLSFGGLNVEVNSLHLMGYRQESFKGIHRELHNIKSLVVGTDIDDIGVLPFAMLDSGIQVFPNVTDGIIRGWHEPLRAVNDARKEGLNVHDIQEKLMDMGHGKYARL